MSKSVFGRIIVISQLKVTPLPPEKRSSSFGNSPKLDFSFFSRLDFIKLPCIEKEEYRQTQVFKLMNFKVLSQETYKSWVRPNYIIKFHRRLG